MQIVLNGLISGSAIALLALSFQLVYLPTRVFFIGLAGLYSLVPYIVNLLLMSGLPLLAAILVTGVLIAGLSVFLEWANHAPLTRKGASEGTQLISSLGIYIILVQAIALLWGNDTKTLRPGVSSTISFGETILTTSQLIMAGVAFLMLAGFFVLLRRTDIGLRLRALSDNPTQFALFGYNVDAHRLIAFAFSGLMATASSLLTAFDVGFDPYVGLHSVLLAVVAVILGGRNSFVGPVVGGLLLGLVRAEVVWYLSSRWQEAVTFAVLIFFLLIRPQGLFGKKVRMEATVS